VHWCSAGARASIESAESTSAEPGTPPRLKALDYFLIYSEAERNLRFLAGLAEGSLYDETGETVASAPPAAPLTPSKRCCEYPESMCPGDEAEREEWQHESWKALHFDPSFGPHFLQYTLLSNDDGWTARAVADLDCSGAIVSFQLSRDHRDLTIEAGPDGLAGLSRTELIEQVLPELAEQSCRCRTIDCMSESRRRIAKLSGGLILDPLSYFGKIQSFPEVSPAVKRRASERALPCLAKLREEQSRVLGSASAEEPLISGFLEAWGEATSQIQKITRGANQSFTKSVMDDGRPPAFPESAPMTPNKGCCQGAGGRCAGASADWGPEWEELDFSIEAPHLLQYEFQSTEDSFSIGAQGELGCGSEHIIRVERSCQPTEELNIQCSPFTFAITVEGVNRPVTELTADVAEGYAARLCGAPAGATLESVLGEGADGYASFFENYVVRRFRGVLAGMPPPATPAESRILEAYERISLCIAELTIAGSLERSVAP